MDRRRLAVCAGVVIVVGVFLVMFRSGPARQVEGPAGPNGTAPSRLIEHDPETGSPGQSQLVGPGRSPSASARPASVRPATAATTDPPQDEMDPAWTRWPQEAPETPARAAVREAVAAYVTATGLDKIETARAEGSFEHVEPDGTVLKARLVILWQKPDKMLELLLDDDGSVINRQLFVGMVTQSENLRDGETHMNIRDEINPGNDLLGLSFPAFSSIMETAEPVLLTRPEMERMFPEEDMETLAEKPAIEMTSKKDGPYVRLLFDEKSSSMLGMEMFHSEGSKPVVRAGVVSYKEFEPGIRLPEKIVVHNDYEGIFRVTFDKVSTNIELPEDTFAAKSMPLDDVTDLALDVVNP